ncbi:Tad domain-containing protein [Marinibactrum halimedae]|uniref:Putative Flp pilus-assembly TadG-like N-terminal domain-containing protein n=1 Tax=Marinibactrum halimedae TaxID=1444977 RepID=A0AA37T021_9GAMM|nr:Tad domain-containing protein [Marinibactrum halimedae]MCD9460287.1 Tad domain-containing protein [Marinibactrum halimedae]GLS24374.1 hypothetical protein GCM10007877_00850 [Marinibactrum halimedae]
MNKSFKLKQDGQALVYIIALLIPIALGGAIVFNSFSLSNEKTRLQNAADAVAYSVATIEARDLNFKAYTNRAMVANQVAVAQVVGFVSWVRWMQNVSRNLSLVTSWIPYVNAVTRAINQVMTQVRNGVERAAPAIASGLDLQNTLLTNAQNIMHVGTVAVAGETAREVARANDRSIDTGLSFSNAALFSDYARNHARFSRRFSPNTVRNSRRYTSTYRQHFERVEELREITMESRDPFSRSRNYVWFSLRLWPVQFEMRRAGGTDLTGQDRRHRYGGWVAMDTMSWHTRRWRCSFRGCGWRGWGERIPIGWGAAKTSTNNENVSLWHRHNRENNSMGRTWRTNRRASNLASTEYNGAREVKQGARGYGGLRPFYDLALNGLIQKAPGIKIILSKPQGSVRTARGTGYNSGAMNIEQNARFVQNRMSAMSEAVPYFARANDLNGYRRLDNRREYGNLYNPYWQARLDTISDNERRTMQVIAGVL